MQEYREVLGKEMDRSAKKDKWDERFSQISDHCYGSEFGWVVRSSIIMKSIPDRPDPGRGFWRPVSGLYKEFQIS